MIAPQRAWLPGGRLHLQHGPIDLIIGAQGTPAGISAAFERAWSRFGGLLASLVRELDLLRTPLADIHPLARDPVARRMVAACWPHRSRFITPMAAVAGSVADEMLAEMLDAAELDTAYVNDGGDIAVWVAPGHSLTAGVVDHPQQPALGAALRLEEPCGIATSGWRGRSQSLGIADTVTVLARDAAAADAAATLLANAVDADHPAVRRAPANRVRHDSDLGERLVTIGVGELPEPLVAQALDRGVAAAHAMQRAGLVAAAYFALQGRSRVVTPDAAAGCAKLRATGGTASC